MSKDKDKKQTTKFDGRMLFDDREYGDLVDSELNISKKSENMSGSLTCCNNVEAKEDDVSKSTTVVDEAESVMIEEYSKVDEISLDGFNLMVERTRQEKACENVDVGMGDDSMFFKTLGKFLKPVITTNVQDGACSVAIKENGGRITSLPQSREEGNAGGSSSSGYCASDTSHSTKKSKVISTLSADDIREECEAKFDNLHDAYEYLVEFIVESNTWVVQLKKERRQVKHELAIVKSELQKWTKLSQANNGVIDIIDDFLLNL